MTIDEMNGLLRRVQDQFDVKIDFNGNMSWRIDTSFQDLCPEHATRLGKKVFLAIEKLLRKELDAARVWVYSTPYFTNILIHAK